LLDDEYNKIKQQIICDYQASTTTLLMCWKFSTYLSHLYTKEWRLEDYKRLTNNLQSAKTLQKLLHIKVHLEFL